MWKVKIPVGGFTLVQQVCFCSAKAFFSVREKTIIRDHHFFLINGFSPHSGFNTPTSERSHAQIPVESQLQCWIFSLNFIFLLNAVISRLADADANANAVPCCLIPRQILIFSSTLSWRFTAANVDAQLLLRGSSH